MDDGTVVRTDDSSVVHTENGSVVLTDDGGVVRVDDRAVIYAVNRVGAGECGIRTVTVNPGSTNKYPRGTLGRGMRPDVHKNVPIKLSPVISLYARGHMMSPQIGYSHSKLNGSRTTLNGVTF